MIKQKLIIWTIPSGFATAMIIVVVASLAMGCSFLKDKRPYDRRMKARELAMIKDANESFLQNDFEKALEIYESLSENSRNSEIRRIAGYGLACTKLMTADSPDEQENALTLWNQWIEQSPDKFRDEDPRLMGLYIQKTTPPCQKDAEIKLVREKNRLLEKEIETLQTRVVTLESQISSLEAIDQKIQEKKKEISAP